MRYIHIIKDPKCLDASLLFRQSMRASSLAMACLIFEPVTGIAFAFRPYIHLAATEYLRRLWHTASPVLFSCSTLHITRGGHVPPSSGPSRYERDRHRL